jgi:hypothetical protein
MLQKRGIECKVVMVVDNNCIDREVHQYKPTHVFIEALWVVPSKFHVLLPKYPNIKWCVRLHSKVPFLANEGIALNWMQEYKEIVKQYKNFSLSANNLDTVKSFQDSLHISIDFHPNVYCPIIEPNNDDRAKRLYKNVLNIGCFGAVRPMKNHLYQAMSAISFANKIKKPLRFHINGDRMEQKGEQVYKNLVHAFEGTPHQLITHPWMNHVEFIKLVETMDMGMQVSFSETFNIVAADFVWSNVPIVGSYEIDWLSFLYKANPTNQRDIVFKLYIAYYGMLVNLQRSNKYLLDSYNLTSSNIWLKYLNH